MDIKELLNQTDHFAADHHKIPSVQVSVTNQEGKLICHVTGMGYRKSKPLPKE